MIVRVARQGSSVPSAPPLAGAGTAVTGDV
jgi:hypothetical protein